MAERGAPPHAWIALGANLGDPDAALRAALRELEALGRVTARSSLWRTAPVGGPPGQPDYRNAVAGLEPRAELAADPAALLAALHAIEARAGRVRRVRWEARPLDLDLLDLGGLVRDGPPPVLPHPRTLERAFVLAPLLEVAPAWRDPRTGERASDAWARLERAGGTGGVERIGPA